jgi:glyoxylase-like metal-dependent hydrolase (beta-lactamase superfamily II)
MFHFCKQKGVKPTGLLLTHQHFDHVNDAALFHENEIPIYASEPFSRDLQLEGLLQSWGLKMQIEEFAVEHILTTESSSLPLAGLEFELRSVPGHSPDSFVFHVALFQKLFSGDTLFANGGIGRTDFPHGDHELLIRSIREQLLTLPANTEILPGHGPSTTIEQEILKNPYLA